MPDLNAAIGFEPSITNRAGTRLNQARKCNPKGWNERESSKAERKITRKVIKTGNQNIRISGGGYQDTRTSVNKFLLIH